MGNFPKKNSYTAKSAEKHRVSAYYYPGPVFYLKKKKKTLLHKLKVRKNISSSENCPEFPTPLSTPCVIEFRGASDS